MKILDASLGPAVVALDHTQLCGLRVQISAHLIQGRATDNNDVPQYTCILAENSSCCTGLLISQYNIAIAKYRQYFLSIAPSIANTFESLYC